MFSLLRRWADRTAHIRLLTAIFAAIACFVAPLSQAGDNFLEPEKAFRFSARMLDAKTAEVTYDIAEGYYMYHDRFAFKADGAKLGQPSIPKGKVKFDETFQKDVETHRKSVAITIPVEASGNFTLKSTGQGCADQGLCYPPMESVAMLSPAEAGSAAPTGLVGGGAAAGISSVAASSSDPEMGRIEASLRSGKLVAILPLFLLLGLGLAFTPCVLPMVPILSSIIVGEGTHVSRSRGFTLSASYSLGMALVYTLLGVAAGLIGEGLAAALQNPWVLSTFALLMVLLSLSMFGVYQIQMPAAIQTRLTMVSERQATGKLFGVFAMGAISALIVGPCVAAPLAGALLYISQTRDIVIGGSALFAMAIGMSLPLLMVGVSAGALLPRAGAWMESVKFFFGVVMLGMALWIVTPVIPGWVPMLGWAALGIGYGIYLMRGKRWGWISKAIGLSVVSLGLVQLVGAATGGTDALSPLSHLVGGVHKTNFKRVKTTAELDDMLAKSSGKAVMLDFYADWCVSCKEMEKLTFSDRRVQAQFANMVLLQADVTANNDDDKALLKRFQLFGPPGIIFFDAQGREVQGSRVIGYQDADRFLQSLARATAQASSTIATLPEK
ncbi:MAG TPA: protein-disulfide reductase DsbD [Noviherbaspirillum sp.]|uniref:protein-disulfide reductase DsbD n=1 Tax=Noviherbaspirillum sp. TaxID=1926288 RepID=UPI002B474D83|nr:protein-disulfide reductase DsbD [Noviherbaspirillum sp.]HJV87814.1 protein-disulfide reductase DsbD [Noviherbaspirillum sp.]